MDNKRATNWSQPIPTEEAHKRAAGRRRYNAARQDAARQRLETVLKLRFNRGLNQSEIARRLGVHRSTICRDFAEYDRLMDRVRAMRRGESTRDMPRGPYRYSWRISTVYQAGEYLKIRVSRPSYN